MSKLKLDDRDVRILAILSREGRISKAELAKRVNLSPTPCWERLKRLEQAGIIEGYRADVAYKKIAPHVVVFVLAELEHHTTGDFHAFEKTVKGMGEVAACWALGGGFDYLLQVITRDIESYQTLIDDLLARKVGLKRYFTYIVTKPVKMDGPSPVEVLLQG